MASPEREAYIEYLAKCRQAFRPFSPIDLPEFFKGRLDKIALLVSELQTPGRQVAIYGERGVGKTSLAVLAYFYAGFPDASTHFVRCERSSNYNRIFGHLLMKAGIEYLPNGREIESSLGIGVKGGPISAQKGKRSRSKSRSIDAGSSIGPDLLLRIFKENDGLLVIDEYDRVNDSETHVRLAETLKHFSDACSKTKIIVVGVSNTVTGLVGEHESLTRSLAQIKLERMTNEELTEIIDTGAERTNVAFLPEVRERIVLLSDGFPFYTHLLGLYCAEDAGRMLLENKEAKVSVGQPELERAIRRAIEGAEGSLFDDYQNAVITTKRKTEMFKLVVWGVAYAQQREVHIKEIAQNIAYLVGQAPRVEALSNYLGPLTKPEKSNVLYRVRQGYYKFSNPLMRAYVRLILERHNIIEAKGQLKFPWMRNQPR